MKCVVCLLAHCYVVVVELFSQLVCESILKLCSPVVGVVGVVVVG